MIINVTIIIAIANYFTSTNFIYVQLYAIVTANPSEKRI